MVIDPLFPVPLAYVDVDDKTRIDTQTKVLSWLNTNSVPTNDEEQLRTTYFSGRQILQQLQLFDLGKAILSACNDFVSSIGGRIPDTFEVESWLNVFENGSNENFHEHLGSCVSGCYYVQADEHGAKFVVADPLKERQMWVNQISCKTDNPFTCGSVGYDPKPGRMLIFPPWMTHGVLKHNGIEPRISLAFNVSWK